MTYSKMFFTAVATTALFTSVYAQKATGKLGVKKDQQFSISNSVNANISMEAMGQSIEVITEGSTVSTLKINEVTKTGVDLSASITKMKINTSVMGQETNFDSEKKEDIEGPMGGKLKGLLNNPKKVTVDFSGKVTSSQTADTASASEEVNMLNQMMNSYGDDSYGTTAAFLVIPANKKIGDTWSDSTSTEGIKTTYTYTYKAQTGADATIGIAGKQKINKKVEAQGMETTVEAENTITGEAIVITASGIVKTKNLTTDGTGTTDMMGQSIPLTSKTTTVTTVTIL